MYFFFFSKCHKTGKWKLGKRLNTRMCNYLIYRFIITEMPNHNRTPIDTSERLNCFIRVPT